MKKPREKWRHALRWLMWLIAAAVLAVALLPVWFPWAARPVLGHYGLRYGDYDRIGFTRFLLNEVQGEWQQTHLQVGQVECVLPTVWLWRKLIPGATGEPGLILTNGLLTVGTRAAPPSDTETKPGSFSGTLDQIGRIGLVLERYLPEARLTDCTITIGATRLLLPHAELRNGRLQALIRPSFAPDSVALDARLEGSASLALSVSSPERQTGLQGKFTRGPEHWNWAGELSWLTNRADLSARFAAEGWWPEQARLDAPQLRVPSDMVRLQGYEDLTGTLELDLKSNQFSLQAAASALPDRAAEGGDRPPVQVTLRAHGDPDLVTLDELHVAAPWLQAELSEPIGIRRTGELLEKAAQLTIALDLAKVPGAALAGKISGGVSVQWDGNRQPVAQFDVTGEGVKAWGVDMKTAVARGKFEWPQLTLDGVSFTLEDGSQLEADGALDLAARTLGATNWRVSGPFLQRFLPDRLSYGALEGSGTASGPLGHLTHTGKIAVEHLEAAPLKPVRATAVWSGTGRKFSSVEIELAAAESVLSLGGEVDLGAQEMAITLQNAVLRRQDVALYSLQQPCRVVFRSGPAGASPRRWSLTVDAFEWRGDGKALAVATRLDWPLQGNLQVSVTKATLRDFADFADPGFSNISLTQFDGKANWADGPVQLSVSAEVLIEDGQDRSFTVKGTAEGAELLKVQVMTSGSEFAPALTIEGTLPFQAVPNRGKDWLVVDAGGAIALEASMQAGEQETVLALGPLGKLRIDRPRLQAQASGTLEQPTATLLLEVEGIHWQRPGDATPSPQFNQLKLDATIATGLVELRKLAVTLDNQPVEASGQLTLASGFWKKLWSDRKAPDWRQASGQLKIQDAEVALLARYLPKVLAPEGRLDLDVTLAEGGKLGGMLTLTNVSTRPLGTVAPVREISARIKLEGSQAVLEEFRGQIGGQPLEAGGTVGFAQGEALDYQLHLKGSNVPVARSLALLLRGDFDLQLQGGRKSPPVLSGEVTLHHGLYVRYASDLLWSGAPQRPEMRPPYFSVTEEPLAGWKLDLRIRGDRFLNVRVPVFRGVVSANVDVSGTLREPVPSGDVRLHSGWLLFPFGTLAVDEGLVTFNGNDPRGPELRLRAAGRTLDYEMRLELTGPANEPDIKFSSTPPLNSDEILLLLTAGELPDRQTPFSTEARAARLVTFLGRDLFGRFSGATEEEPRLSIKTGESISEDGKITYSVEYRLDDRWSIIGEYDRFNAFNTDLKWKVLSR